MEYEEAEFCLGIAFTVLEPHCGGHGDTVGMNEVIGLHEGPHQLGMESMIDPGLPCGRVEKFLQRLDGRIEETGRIGVPAGFGFIDRERADTGLDDG